MKLSSRAIQLWLHYKKHYAVNFNTFPPKIKLYYQKASLGACENLFGIIVARIGAYSSLKGAIMSTCTLNKKLNSILVLHNANKINDTSRIEDTKMRQRAYSLSFLLLVYRQQLPRSLVLLISTHFEIFRCVLGFSKTWTIRCIHRALIANSASKHRSHLTSLS